MNRRVKKKVKRKIKTWVKLAFLGFVTLVVAGILVYGWYQKKMNEEDPTGTIIETEQQGTIADISEETWLLTPLEYIVLDIEGEGILVDYGTLEILINSPSGVSPLIKDRVDGELDYIVLTNNSPVRTSGLSEVSKDFMVKNVVGGSIDGVTELPSGETIILGDRFSLSTIKTDRGLAIYLIYQDTGFLALGDLSPDDEYQISTAIGNIDVIVPSSFGMSENNRLIKEKGPRYIAVSQMDYSVLGEDLFESAGKNPIYATGKTGSLLFSTTGQVVTAAFDVKDALTLEGIKELQAEALKEAEKDKGASEPEEDKDEDTGVDG